MKIIRSADKQRTMRLNHIYCHAIQTILSPIQRGKISLNLSHERSPKNASLARLFAKLFITLAQIAECIG